MTVGRVVAGIDIGNSTTEVVLALLPVGSGAPEVVVAGRAPTRRAKGSPESLDGASALVRRLERERGVRIERAVAARLRPVSTRTTLLPAPPPDTGRLAIAGAGARTAGRPGFAVGRPHRLGCPVPRGAGPVVAVAPAGLGYREVVRELAALGGSGVRVVGVVLEHDEGVLVAHRWPGEGPVVDEVALAGAGIDDGEGEPSDVVERVAVEVAEPGGRLRVLADPLRVVTELELSPDERSAAARLALELSDRSNAVVVRRGSTAAGVAGRGPQNGLTTADGHYQPFPAAHGWVREASVGAVRHLTLDGAVTSVDDLWSVDLRAVATASLARAGSVPAGSAVLASVRTAAWVDPAAGLAERLGVPVEVLDEARAGRAGALSTPGAPDGAGVVVVDLGGGTVDVTSAAATVVAAGAGEMLTAAVATLTGTTAAAAEHVKRGPAQQVHAPQVLIDEDGARSFTDRPMPPSSQGGLVVPGPAGPLTFGTGLGLGEWRALRLRLKVDALGANVARALRTLGEHPSTVIVVGGPGGDDEMLSIVARALPPGVAVARGQVAGHLGHRYAVAYGLLLG